MQVAVPIKRERKRRWTRSAAADAMRLTPRDVAIVVAAWLMGYVTTDQMCDLLFDGQARSNCQRRMTLLHQHGYLAKLPDRAVNEPDVYEVSRDAPAGLRLLHTQTPQRDLVHTRRFAPQVGHVLAINDVRCRLQRSASASGLTIDDWRDQGDLAWLGLRIGAVPDGFFLLRRSSDAGVLASACFLEVERSPRGPRAVQRKYTRLREYYASGSYRREFAYQSLRVLTVCCHASVESEERWASVLRSHAAKSGLSFAWFASLRRLMAVAPSELFRAPIWLRPGVEAPSAFGDLTMNLAEG